MSQFAPGEAVQIVSRFKAYPVTVVFMWVSVKRQQILCIPTVGVKYACVRSLPGVSAYKQCVRYDVGPTLLAMM